MAQKKANEIEDNSDEKLTRAKTEAEERDILLTGDPIIEQSSEEELSSSCPKNNDEAVTKKEDGCPNSGDCSGEGVVTEQSPEPEPSNPPTPTKGDEVDGDLKKSLEEVDPWMANKLKESDDCSS